MHEVDLIISANTSLFVQFYLRCGHSQGKREKKNVCSSLLFMLTVGMLALLALALLLEACSCHSCACVSACVAGINRAQLLVISETDKTNCK